MNASGDIATSTLQPARGFRGWVCGLFREARPKVEDDIIPASHRRVAIEICVARGDFVCQVETTPRTYINISWMGGSAVAKVKLSRDKTLICSTEFRRPYGGISVHSDVPEGVDREAALTEMRDAMLLARDVARRERMGKEPGWQP